MLVSKDNVKIKRNKKKTKIYSKQTNWLLPARRQKDALDHNTSLRA